MEKNKRAHNKITITIPDSKLTRAIVVKIAYYTHKNICIDQWN